MLKIAVIDTGSDYFSGGVAIDMQNTNTANDTSDHHGHGTAIATMLAALCPEGEIVPVRIAQMVDGKSTVFVPEKVLAMGIDWCVDNHIRLVNISYSIEDISDRAGR